MSITHVTDCICKTCALIAAALVLPALAFAGDKDKDKDKGDKDKDPRPIPEASSAWVLAPIVGVVLLLSWQQLRRAKA
jgi:hypothetical protein